MIRTWSVYVNEGLITGANWEENPSRPLSEELASAYLGDDGGTVKQAFPRVGRGKFLLIDEARRTSLSPTSEIWSRAAPRHLVTLANPEN